MKSECRQQLLDGELDSLKLRLNQVNNEKDEQLQLIKHLETKQKELQVKYEASEQSWMRLKSEMSEKQRKVTLMFLSLLHTASSLQYDESIKLKSELQNAVERLRQKLYDLETHSQEKQTKYTIDKQQWEVQRLEFIGKINEVIELVGTNCRTNRSAASPSSTSNYRK